MLPVILSHHTRKTNCSQASQEQQKEHCKRLSPTGRPILRATYELESSKTLEALLKKREKDLKRRREHVERLIHWHRRLDEEETEVLQLEKQLLACNKSSNFKHKLRLSKEQRTNLNQDTDGDSIETKTKIIETNVCNESTQSHIGESIRKSVPDVANSSKLHLLSVSSSHSEETYNDKCNIDNHIVEFVNDNKPNDNNYDGKNEQAVAIDIVNSDNYLFNHFDQCERKGRAICPRKMEKSLKEISQNIMELNRMPGTTSTIISRYASVKDFKHMTIEQQSTDVTRNIHDTVIGTNKVPLSNDENIQLADNQHDYSYQAPDNHCFKQGFWDNGDAFSEEVGKQKYSYSSGDGSKSVASDNLKSEINSNNSPNMEVDYVQATGIRLNKLWYRLTSKNIEKFEPMRRYRLYKSDLEHLYEEAKLTVLRDFTQDEECIFGKLLEKSVSKSASSSSTIRLDTTTTSTSTLPSYNSDKQNNGIIALMVPKLNLNFSGPSDPEDCVKEENGERKKLKEKKGNTRNKILHKNDESMMLMEKNQEKQLKLVQVEKQVNNLIYSPSVPKENILTKHDEGYIKQSDELTSNHQKENDLRIEIKSDDTLSTSSSSVNCCDESTSVRMGKLEKNVELFLALTQRIAASSDMSNRVLQRSLSDTLLAGLGNGNGSECELNNSCNIFVSQNNNTSLQQISTNASHCQDQPGSAPTTSSAYRLSSPSLLSHSSSSSSFSSLPSSAQSSSLTVFRKEQMKCSKQDNESEQNNRKYVSSQERSKKRRSKKQLNSPLPMLIANCQRSRSSSSYEEIMSTIPSFSKILNNFQAKSCSNQKMYNKDDFMLVSKLQNVENKLYGKETDGQSMKRQQKEKCIVRQNKNQQYSSTKPDFPSESILSASPISTSHTTTIICNYFEDNNINKNNLAKNTKFHSLPSTNSATSLALSNESISTVNDITASNVTASIRSDITEEISKNEDGIFIPISSSKDYKECNKSHYPHYNDSDCTLIIVTEENASENQEKETKSGNEEKTYDRTPKISTDEMSCNLIYPCQLKESSKIVNNTSKDINKTGQEEDKPKHNIVVEEKQKIYAEIEKEHSTREGEINISLKELYDTFVHYSNYKIKKNENSDLGEIKEKNYLQEKIMKDFISEKGEKLTIIEPEVIEQGEKKLTIKDDSHFTLPSSELSAKNFATELKNNRIVLLENLNDITLSSNKKLTMVEKETALNIGKEHELSSNDLTEEVEVDLSGACSLFQTEYDTDFENTMTSRSTTTLSENCLNQDIGNFELLKLKVSKDDEKQSFVKEEEDINCLTEEDHINQKKQLSSCITLTTPLTINTGLTVTRLKLESDSNTVFSENIISNNYINEMELKGHQVIFDNETVSYVFRTKSRLQTLIFTS